MSFGQPYAWKARPKALKLQYYAEKIGIADIDKNFGAPIREGDQDKARIMVAIVDWNTRREVSDYCNKRKALPATYRNQPARYCGSAIMNIKPIGK